MTKFTSFSTGFSGICGRGFVYGEYTNAVGGDIVTTAGAFKTHVFKNSGTLLLNVLGSNASAGAIMEVLVVAGGVGGSIVGWAGGGGGGSSSGSVGGNGGTAGPGGGGDHTSPGLYVGAAGKANTGGGGSTGANGGSGIVIVRYRYQA